MKILMLDPSLFTAPYDGELCRALNQAGHEVMLVCRSPRNQDEAEWLTGIKTLTVYRLSELLRRQGFEAYRLLKPIEHLIFCFKIAFLCIFKKVDVVHFQWTVLPILDFFLVSLIKNFCEVVFTYHDSKYLHGEGARLQVLGLRKFTDCFNKIIVHTVETKDVLISRGINPQSIHIIAHGVLNLPFDRKLIKQKTSPIKTILLFGSLRPYKGVEVLLNAWAQIPIENKSGWRVLILGQGDSWYVESLKKLGSTNTEFQIGFFSNQDLAEALIHSEITVFAHEEIDASGAFFTALPLANLIIAPRVGAFKECDSESCKLFSSNLEIVLLENMESFAQVQRGQSDSKMNAYLKDGWDARALALYKMKLQDL